MKSKRQEIFAKIPKHVEVCVVTKGRTLKEVQELLAEIPEISMIGENRWPDCEEKFKKLPLEKHFIGRLQSNKLNKILPLVDVIQSVDSFELLQKISQRAQKTIKYTFQVNISNDPAKQGILPKDLRSIIEKSRDIPNSELIGLMTIGEQHNQEEYFTEFKKLFDQLNSEGIKMKVLSMGTSDDFEIAIRCGATMVRIGKTIFS